MDPAAASKFKEDVVSKIRSCLISTKGQITLRKLEEDYHMLIGERIPHGKLGFKNLESFVQSVPTLQVTRTHDGNIYVDAKATAQTAHISDMVLRQKSVTKKKPPIRMNKGRWTVPNRQYHHHHGNTGYRPNFNNTRPQPMGNRTAYKPMQFVNRRPPNQYQSQQQNHHHHQQQQQHQQQPAQRQFSNASSSSSSSVSSSPSPPSKNSQQQQQQQQMRPQVPSMVTQPNNSNHQVQQQPQQPQQPQHANRISSPPPRTPPSTPPTPASVNFQNSSNYGSATSSVSFASQTNSIRSPRTTVDSSTQSTPTPIENGASKIKSPNTNNNILLDLLEANPLQSAKRRISKFMEEHQNDRDSGTSSPTNGSTVGIMESLVFGGDPLADLKLFVNSFRLGDLEVTFSNTKPKTKGSKKIYYCKIKFGTSIYSSYPHEHYDEKSAERFTAQKALDELVPTHTKRRSLLLSGDEDVLVRVPPMLEKHTNALWTTQVETSYVEKYNEQLPPNWLQVIDSSPYVSMQKCPGGYVLRYCKPGDKGKLLDINLNIYDVSVPCNTVSFNDSNQLFAVISVAVSVSEIWCFQIGIPEYDSFVEMSNNMETFYAIAKNKENMQPKVVSNGSCYAVKNHSGWARVKALETMADGNIHCFMIDVGEECIVAKDELFYLRKEFASEQAQAFVCRLDGLEDLRETSLKSKYLQELNGKTVCLELVEEVSPEFNNISILNVNMYDVETEELINDEIVTSLTVESATPSLDKIGITQVHVSNVEKNGDIYVQVRNAAYDRFTELMEALMQYLTNEPSEHLLHVVTREVADTSKIYLYKNKDNCYERVQFLDWSPDGEYAQIYHVDVGSAEVVNLKAKKMLVLEQLDKLMGRYPPQALKVRMMIEQMPSNLVEMVAKHMPPTKAVLLKIISYDNEKVPWVEFFTRSNDLGLFCVNKSIAVESELENATTDNSNNNDISKHSSRLLQLMTLDSGTRSVPSGGVLKKPSLPEKGHYFNVNVPFAVNPWNFFVQPLETFDTLKEMMEEMQLVYKDAPPHFTSLDQLDQVIPGHIYASEHEDGRWYRTCVLKVITSGSISVFYCDFGYYTNLALGQLIPLDKKFMDLPYQALKARIHGIQPKKEKWTMEDCEVFKNLVTKKQFVSILVDIEKDQLHSSDILLQLLLIDTTSAVDVHIKDLMVDRGIATSVN